MENESYDSNPDDFMNKILIIKGDIKSGGFDKNAFSKTSKGLIHTIYNDLGAKRTKDFIDDLQNVVNANMEERLKEAENAMEIIKQEVTKFNNWFSTLDAIPTIVEMRNRAEDMRALEVDKTLKNMDHLSSEDKDAIQQLTQSLVN